MMYPCRSLKSWSAFALLLAVVPACAAPAAGGGPAAPGAPPVAAAPTVTPQMLAQGSSIFGGPGRCTSCHGQGGVGTSLAPNLTDNEWIWINPAQPLVPQLEPLIRNGIPQPRQYGFPMPAMGGANLNETQITNLSAYVASLSGG